MTRGSGNISIGGDIREEAREVRRICEQRAEKISKSTLEDPLLCNRERRKGRISPPAEK
jgi:hypothetical protein